MVSLVAQAGAWAAVEQPSYRNLTSPVIPKEPIKKALGKGKVIKVVEVKELWVGKEHTNGEYT